MSKKFWVFFIIGAFLITFAGSVYAETNDDYKVIKNAIKGSKVKNSGVLYFRVSVKDTKTNRTRVKIRLPLNLIEFLLDSLDENLSIHKSGKKINFKTVLQLLKTNGPQTLIEVAEEESTVKIWIE